MPEFMTGWPATAASVPSSEATDASLFTVLAGKGSGAASPEPELDAEDPEAEAPLTVGLVEVIFCPADPELPPDPFEDKTLQPASRTASPKAHSKENEEVGFTASPGPAPRGR